MDITKCILYIYPDFQCSVRNNDYATIQVPASEIRTIPTYAELEAVWADVQAAEVSEETRITTKAQAIVDNLPSWSQVESDLDAISNLAEAKAALKKLARVVYWLAKDTQD